ncbi:uncharacterized protein LOC122261696 [Penaeus japonicus]|uniref:uncharacterized protein LOC122261696 n=1 Tax=Penaeus japonicus TaxID=27405 RepID=UPI001C713F03|nr:uncharacterized protein LOC122261696 [Penaeus japonicus]
MAFPGQIIVLLAVFSIQGGLSADRCDYEQIKCKTTDQCVLARQICNGNNDCGDHSDEEPALCNIWKFSAHQCHNSHCNPWNCDFHTYCKYCDDLVDPKACKMVNARRIIIDSGMELSEDSVALLTTAVNTTLASPAECPMLYERIGNHCLAFFSLAKVPWPEARQFCKSIFGDLVTLKNIQEYAQVIEHMKEALLTTDFWIGGRYDMDVNAWAWVDEDAPMPLGSPFWGEKYSSSCVPRPPPHTDPFRNPPDALPEAPCLHYVQSPQERQQGWCSAMTYEHPSLHTTRTRRLLSA